MGEVFAGRYELVDPIGRGGVGAVWRAWDHRRRRYVAAKVLQQRDAHSLLRFVREQALRIDHPNVLAPASWAADDDKVLFTMDLVTGGSLVHLVNDYGPLPPAFVCTLLDQLLAGLAAVHAEEVVHRDVKPANVLLEATGTGRPRLRLSDFGIAMRLGEPRLTDTNLVVGTPGYIAPEQLLGAEPDFPADLYAAGLVALYLLEGAKPDAKALVEHFAAHGTPNAPKGIPEPLWQVVATLIQPDPEARFRTATGARKALASAAELLPEPGPDDEVIEIFDQLGPLPAGYGPDGPLRRASGLHEGTGSRTLPASGPAPDSVSDPRRSADPSPSSQDAQGSPGSQVSQVFHASSPSYSTFVSSSDPRSPAGSDPRSPAGQSTGSGTGPVDRSALADGSLPAAGGSLPAAGIGTPAGSGPVPGSGPAAPSGPAAGPGSPAGARPGPGDPSSRSSASGQLAVPGGMSDGTSTPDAPNSTLSGRPSPLAPSPAGTGTGRGSALEAPLPPSAPPAGPPLGADAMGPPEGRSGPFPAPVGNEGRAWPAEDPDSRSAPGENRAPRPVPPPPGTAPFTADDGYPLPPPHPAGAHPHTGTAPLRSTPFSLPAPDSEATTEAQAGAGLRRLPSHAPDEGAPFPAYPGAPERAHGPSEHAQTAQDGQQHTPMLHPPYASPQFGPAAGPGAPVAPPHPPYLPQSRLVPALHSSPPAPHPASSPLPVPLTVPVAAQQAEASTASYTAQVPRVPSPERKTARHAAGRAAARKAAAARRPGPSAKVAVPLILLALVCYAVGFWALTRI